MLAAALLAAACGGDGGDGGASAVPSPPQQSDSERALHAPGMSAKPFELPAAGTYTYDVSGTSSLGALPPTTTFVVEDIAGQRQRWTLNRPDRDGQATRETLELLSDFDGLRIAAHRIEHTTPAGPLVIDLAAAQRPPLYVPYFRKPGEWSFDLSSADGCYSARTEVFIREVDAPVVAGAATFTGYRADLNQTVKGDAAKAGCQAVSLVSEQTLWLDKGSRLPVLDSMKRRGTGGGLGITSEVLATIRSTTPS